MSVTPFEMQSVFSAFQFATGALQSAAFTANDIGPLGGAPLVIYSNTGATPGTLTTRTAALMISDGNLFVGQRWTLIIVNTVTTNAATIAGGTGVTIGGTATVAGFTGRLFSALVTSASAITITGIAFSWTVAGA